jgi:hypothetical protein
MSLTARRYTQPRHTCPCGRRALFTTGKNRRCRARADHAMCSRCYRSLVASTRGSMRRRP